MDDNFIVRLLRSVNICWRGNVGVHVVLKIRPERDAIDRRAGSPGFIRYPCTRRARNSSPQLVYPCHFRHVSLVFSGILKLINDENYPGARPQFLDTFYKTMENKR